MLRNLTIVLLVLTTAACEQDAPGKIAQAGVFTTVGALRTWRLEPPPPDTIHTVTRRIWWGSDADFLGVPSPDGTQLAHHVWATGDIAIRDLETGESRSITQNPMPYYPGFAMFPHISRDGSQVAYVWWNSETTGSSELRVAGIEDPDPQALSTWEGYLNPEDWSPDGTQIVARRQLEDATWQIVLVSARDGTDRVLKQLDWRGPSNMRISPDGRYVLYDFPADLENEQSHDIYLLPLAGGPEVPLVEHEADDLVLGWAPDGAHVLFQSDRTGTPSAWLLPVSDGTADGPPELVKPDFWNANPMGFTTDGRFFYGVRTSSRSIRIATLNPETGEVVGRPGSGTMRSNGTQMWPSWSPDGQSLAFLVQGTAPNSTPRTLAIRSQATGEERHLRLPMELFYPSQPRWHPDGRTIFVRSQDRQNQYALYSVDVRTGEVEPVFKHPPSKMFRTSFDVFPDGERIVFAHTREREGGLFEYRVVVRDLTSGIEREIYSIGVGETMQIRAVALSPNGETVTIWQMGREDSAILVLPTEGGQAREILRGQLGQHDWMRDGRHLLVRIYDGEGFPPEMGTHLVRVSVETGEVVDLGFSMEMAGQLKLSPDGRLLAFIDGTAASEVWVMEDFLPSRR